MTLLLQENFQLLPERFLPVMFVLRLNMPDRVRHPGNGDAESAKAFLPRKMTLPQFGKGLPQPF